MKAHALPSDPRFKAAFERLIDAPPETWLASIAQMPISDDERGLLHLMVAFDHVAAMPHAEREEGIARLGLDALASSRLREMLGQDGEMPALVRSTVSAGLRQLESGADGVAERALLGTSVGGFRIVSLLGQGGSSLVFKADRPSGAGVQVVALKLLRAGFSSAEAQGRFRREQAILAQITHPDIARLVEGGVDESGVPYLAMEMVDGLPITRAADAHRLGAVQRLRWFVALCRAIEAAHAQLVIHRDIKPSNVFVTAQGQLKVLDFGIAKLVDDTAVTHTRAAMLTPEYAAPEQFRSGPLTTAVDVYALGMVLGELLTGARLAGGSRPSDQVAAFADDAALPPGVGSRQGLVRLLRGDLDAILVTALAEDPARRYPGAAAFADDVERYLAGAPVRAVPPSRGYRLRKFAGRHRAALAAGSLFVLAICGASVFSWRQAQIAQAQARFAHAQAQRAEAVRDLLVSIFQSSDPELPTERRPNIENIVIRAAANLAGQQALPGDVRADLLLALAKVSHGIGAQARAQRLLDVAVPLIASAYGAGSEYEIEAKILQASVMDDGADFAGAVAVLEPVVPRFLADRDERAVHGLRVLGTSLLRGGRTAEGFARLHDAVEMASASRAAAPQRLPALIDEASALIHAHRNPEGLQQAQVALAEWTRQGEPFAPGLIELHGAMATALDSEGRPSDAEAAYRRAIELADRWFDGPNAPAARATGAFGAFLLAHGRTAEARSVLRRALALRTDVYGADHPLTRDAAAALSKLDAVP